MKIALEIAIGTAMLAVAINHAVKTWNQPEYPYSGFQPDCPTWEP